LGRELRALIDFFEHQQDRPVGQVFVAGGSSRSDVIIQLLQTALIAECKRWNPLSAFQLALPPEQLADVDQTAPQMAVAVGAAAALF
jgi:Tfp pilus assembly PilM family ATPase